MVKKATPSVCAGLFDEVNNRAIDSGELSTLALGDAVAYTGVALLSLSLLGSASPDVRKRLGRVGVDQHVRAVMLVSRLEKRLAVRSRHGDSRGTHALHVTRHASALLHHSSGHMNLRDEPASDVPDDDGDEALVLLVSV